MLLCDLGAEVIRAENPEGERDGGFAGPMHEGYSVYYAVYNRGKKSIGLNRSHPEGRELFRKLLPHVDVIVENFRPGYLDRLGFSFEAMQAVNPRLILVSISAYGQDGPYADQTGFCNVALAASGYMDVSGDPFSPLHQTGTSIADRLAGLHAASAPWPPWSDGPPPAGPARGRLAHGRRADHDRVPSGHVSHDRPKRPPSDVAQRRAGSSPNQVFRARDGMVQINTPTQDQWLRLLKLMGRDDLAGRPPLRHPPEAPGSGGRRGHRGAGRRLDTHPDRGAGLPRAGGRRRPGGPVRTIDQVAADPQVLHRRMVQAVRHPQSGLEMRLTGNPVKVSGLPDEVGYPATRGEHNHEIYGKWLGLDADTIADLTRRKVI